MSFPFPPNPVDGQVATQAQPDGTVLRATYDQSKNEWIVERVEVSNTLTLIAGTAYTVTPGVDGQVLTFDAALNRWVPKAPAASTGGAGQTYAKGTKAAADRSNPPDPTRPGQTLQPGALQVTLESLHKELKAWDGAAWALIFGEDEIKQWIAAGNLFRSTLSEAGITGLPAPAATNRGYYWTWAGASGYVVKAGDTPLAPGLVGSVLNPGDWLQSDGTKFVHVSGDLLSKQRWLSLGSFLPWSDTSWESGSVVSYQKAFFRSTTNVQAGDLAPGVTPGDPTEVQKWVDITPLPLMNTGDLSNVNANTIQGGGTHGAVFQWDDNTQQWVASDTLEVSEVNTDTVRFPDLSEITGVATVDVETVLPADEGATVPSVYALKEYVKGQPKPFLEELEDCTLLSTAISSSLTAHRSDSDI